MRTFELGDVVRSVPCTGSESGAYWKKDELGQVTGLVGGFIIVRSLEEPGKTDPFSWPNIMKVNRPLSPRGLALLLAIKGRKGPC